MNIKKNQVTKQNKRIMDYHKIQTLFKRDENGVIIEDQYTLEEFKYLENNLWECTEKIDGTNIHIDFTLTEDGVKNLKIRGRTIRANIPFLLENYLKDTFTADRILKGFRLPEAGSEVPVSIYGEGYGKKVQKCGGRYLKDSVGFIIFDIFIGGFWLERNVIEEIAKSIDIPVVPVIGYYTIDEAIEIVKEGFISKVAEDKTLLAEGLVLKPIPGFLRRNGNRLITKLKTVDFKNSKK